MIDPAIATPDELREEVARLRETVGRMEAANNLDRASRLERAFGLTPSQARVLAILARGEPVNGHQLHAALYAGRRNPPCFGVVRVFVARLRRKLYGERILIRTGMARCYELTIGRDRVCAALDGVAPERIAA